MYPTIDGAASPRAAAAGDRPADGGSGDIAAATKVYTNPLLQHGPDPPDKEEIEGGAADSSIGAPSSSGDGSSSSGGKGGGGGDRHLRKMTQSLVELLESIGRSASQGRDAATHEGRHDSLVAARGDSVATMADLEAGRGGGGAAASSSAAADGGMVPVQHVRRLTTTLVDILRHVAANPSAAGGGEERDGEIEGLGGEASGLLLRPGAERSRSQHERGTSEGGDASSWDKLSLASAATASTASGGTDTGTALLRAAFVKDEYRGDEVKPFYADQPRLASAASRRLEELEEAADDAADGVPKGAAADAGAIPHVLKKRVRVAWIGLLSFIAYIGAFVFYIWARAAHTLGLGSMLWYGAIVLAVEILGGLAMLPYGLCLTCRVTNNDVPPPDEKGQVHTALPYHIRVVVPCYKEPLDVIQRTVTAALVAPIPSNCARTVYLLDDGRDIDKKKFMRSLGVPNAVYVSGRKRAKGEMNGKSANINSAARLLYPAGYEVPLTEVMCVFDADQVPNADFFLKTVPLLDGGQDVGMVLSPQAFHNLNAGGDIFNHANVHFWHYSQPGYDALGLISCTGTNFLVRAKAFIQAGLFPEWTLTEDFALGIELKKLAWQCRYVDEYLAIGEAPDEVRNCFQQRSRWAKGHFQVFFSGRNPVLAKGLSPLMKWMYGSVCLAYFSAFTSTPLLMLVPMITVWLGAFPIVINRWAAIAITVYYAATLLISYHTRALGHLKSMWFSSVANSILWFAFLKAMYRATLGRFLAGRITFKVTAKGLQRIADLPIRDVWVSLLFFVSSLVCLIFGLVHFFRGPLDTPLAISLLFMTYNLIPQGLLLQYTLYRKPLVFNAICKAAMLLSTILLVLGVVLVWLLYPRSYNYSQALTDTLSFFDSQREGYLPPPAGGAGGAASAAAPWRGDAFISDYNTTATLASSLPNATNLFSMDAWSAGGFGTDPFASYNPADPFAGWAGRRLAQAMDPFAGADPFAAPTSGGGGGAGAADPFAAGSGGGGADPFAAGGSGGAEPFGSGAGGSGFNPNDLGSSSSQPLAAAAAGLADVAWDLGGGWMSGMGGGNLKATTPIAFTTTLLVWALMAFQPGFQAAGQVGAALESVRWGADYLLKVHRPMPDANTSMIVTRVGDIDTDMLLWYRPEEAQLPRPAFAVDGTTGAADLGGSVSAALAAASVLFRAQNDTAYAQRLLDKAKEVYDFARARPALFASGDLNLTVLYNTSTYWDDLAWAAGWLYKATKQDSYLTDVYEFYVKHLADEGPIAGFKYAYDWDNVFYPLNLLLAQETGRPTFKDATETLLRNWVCAGNAANYTARGRAYNPMSGSLGATANAASLALMYARQVEGTSAGLAREYRCWALSQVRYMLGDAGRSLIVGFGRNPPQRTQDRGAACPDPPEVCNRVTGLLSPDPDSHVLRGALVYGSGRSDAFQDERRADSAWVGVENNAGLAAALAGVLELAPDDLWPTCLQEFGLVRTSAVCGSYVSI